MRARRPLLPAICLLAGLVAAAPALALTGPKPVRASSGERDVKGELSSYCVMEESELSEPASGVCADFASPTGPPKPRLRVEPGGRVELAFRDVAGIEDDVRNVSVGPLKWEDEGIETVGRALEAKEIEAGRWKLRLPRNLDEIEGISIFARFAGGGDVTSFVGIRSR